MFPKKLDVYITKKFMLTFFIAILLIIGIVIIFDISEKIDDFVAKQAPLKEIIFSYYVNFVPYFMNMFSPLFVFITVIFFTSRMAANSEIIAILSCGISFHRMMLPYIFSASVIALLSLGLNLFVIPRANAERHVFEAEYTKKKAQKMERNIHYQIAPGQFVYVEQFSKYNNTAYKFTLETIENNQLVSKVSAERAVWDASIGGWTLKKYFIREYNEAGLEDNVRCGEQLDTVISLTVDDFFRKKNRRGPAVRAAERADKCPETTWRPECEILIDRKAYTFFTSFLRIHIDHYGRGIVLKKEEGRHRVEPCDRHRPEFLVHSVHEVQPDVRIYGAYAAVACDLAPEHDIRGDCRRPVQDSA